jgi:hypothetical protein
MRLPLILALRFVVLAAMLGSIASIAFAQSSAPAEPSVSGDPERFGARFSFDESVWRRRPPDAGSGINLSCHLPECRPGEWPGLAVCGIAIFTQHDPRWASTAELPRRIDMAMTAKMTAAMIAAPTTLRGRVTSPYRPCANGADAICMSVALEGAGPPGVAFAFMTARNGYRVEGDCRFLPPMTERGPALFDAVLKGFRWAD